MNLSKPDYRSPNSTRGKRRKALILDFYKDHKPGREDGSTFYLYGADYDGRRGEIHMKRKNVNMLPFMTVDEVDVEHSLIRGRLLECEDGLDGCFVLFEDLWI